MSYIRPDEFGYAAYDSYSRMLAKSTFVHAQALYPLGSYQTSVKVEPTLSSHPDLYNRIGGVLQRGKTAISCAVPVSPQDISHDGRSASVIGYTKGLNYYEPTPTLLNSLPDIWSGNNRYDTATWVAGMSISKQQAHVTCYSSAEPASWLPNTYGGMVVNNDRQTIISDAIVPMHVQLTSSGQRVRTANAHQLSYLTASAPSLPGNIIFDKPYDEPPLIFILPGSVPVALWTMNKNEDGKFVSASVVGGYSWNATSLRADQWEGSQFSYVIAANEIPTLYDDNPSTYVDQDFGMQFINEDGEVTYDSRYETCYAATASYVCTPTAAWRYIAGSSFSNQGGSMSLANSVYLGKRSINSSIKFEGVALNSTNAVTGYTWAAYSHITVGLTSTFLGTRIITGMFTDGKDMWALSPCSAPRGMVITGLGVNMVMGDYRREAIVGFFSDEYYQYERRMTPELQKKNISVSCKEVKSPENRIPGIQQVTQRLYSGKARAFAISKEMKMPASTPLIYTSTPALHLNIPPKTGLLETDNGSIDQNVRYNSYLNISLSLANEYLFDYAYETEEAIEYVDAVLAEENQNKVEVWEYKAWGALCGGIRDAESSALHVNLSPENSKYTGKAKIKP